MQRLSGLQFDPAVIKVFNALDHYEIARVEPEAAFRLSAVG